MANRCIATTNRSGLSLAQVGGNDVYKLLPQLQSLMELGNMGQNYMGLFAEPVDNGRTIDWYIDEDGKVESLANLDEAQKKALLDRLGEMLASLEAYAKKLRQNPSDTYRTYADILDKALIVPNIDESLYTINGNPVLINWGFSKGDNEVVDGAQALMKEIQERLEKVKDVNDGIEQGVQTDQPQESGPGDVVQADTANVDANEANTGGEVNAPAGSHGSGAWIAAAITGAGLLAAGAFAVWYFMNKEPGTVPDASTPSLAWLKGDLNARGVLIDEKNEPVDLTLRFTGEDGRGTSIIQSNNQICTGDVIATPQPNNMVAFAMDELKCPDGNNFEPFTMTCTRGESRCTGTNRSGESWELNVNLPGEK